MPTPPGYWDPNSQSVTSQNPLTYGPSITIPYVPQQNPNTIAAPISGPWYGTNGQVLNIPGLDPSAAAPPPTSWIDKAKNYLMNDFNPIEWGQALASGDTSKMQSSASGQSGDGASFFSWLNVTRLITVAVGLIFLAVGLSLLGKSVVFNSVASGVKKAVAA